MTDENITVYVVETEYGRFVHDYPDDAAETSKNYQGAPIVERKMTQAEFDALPAYE